MKLRLRFDCLLLEIIIFVVVRYRATQYNKRRLIEALYNTNIAIRLLLYLRASFCNVYGGKCWNERTP